MDSRTKNSTRNILYGIIQKLFSILLPFIVRSIFIYKLGKEYLGLDSLFVSLLQVLSLAELGFGNALVYSMYKPIADNNINKICKLLNFYRKCYRIIGITILCLGIVISPFLRFLISGDYPQNINIYAIYYIFLLNTVLSYFLSAYKSSLLIAYQRLDIDKKVKLVMDVIKYSIQFTIILLIKNYYLYVIVLPIITILNNIVIFLITNKYYPKIKPKGNISKKELKTIKTNVKGMFLQKLGSMAMNNSDNIVISAILGLNTLAIFNNYYYILSAVSGIFVIIIESIKPSIGNSIVKESVEKNYNDFKLLNFLSIWIVTWISICLSCLMNDFIYLWLGKSMQLPNYISIIFGIYFFVHHWCDLLYVYQEGKGLWWQNRYTQFITAIVNTFLNIVLVKIMGIVGILLATIITVLLITTTGYARVLFGEYFTKNGYIKEYIFSLIRYLIIALLVAIPTYFICSLIKNITIINFLIKLLILIIVPNMLILLLNLKNKQFKISIDFIKNRFLRRSI